MRPMPRFAPLGLLAAGLFSTPLLATPGPGLRPWSSAPEHRPQATAVPATAPLQGATVAGRAGEHQVTFAELDDLLLDRYALAPEGQAALQFLARTTLLEALGAEAGIDVSPAELDVRWREIDAAASEAGVPGGIRGHLETSGVDEVTFRETLRLALVHERLARQGLGIPPEREISGESQQVWLDDQLTAAGFEGHKRPFSDGIIATIGGHPIRSSALADSLREQLPAEDLRGALAQLLLLRALQARMPEADAASVAQAVDRELSERRARAESDPAYQGVSFEELLRARGRDMDSMRRDPALNIAALARIHTTQRYGGDRLRDAYLAERETFDGLFGEAVSARAIWLAADSSGQPRTPAAAQAQLVQLAERITGEAAFAALAVEFSDDPGSAGQGGALGFVTRRTPGVDANLSDLLLIEAEAGVQGVSGPFSIAGGAVLLWLGERRPAPAFEAMAGDIEKELRRRFLEETLPGNSITTFLDPQFQLTPASAGSR